MSETKDRYVAVQPPSDFGNSRTHLTLAEVEAVCHFAREQGFGDDGMVQLQYDENNMRDRIVIREKTEAES